MWPFSAYDPGGAHGSGNLAPETMSDISAEEWRWQFYQAQAAGPEAVAQVKAQWDAGVAERRQIWQALGQAGPSALQGGTVAAGGGTAFGGGGGGGGGGAAVFGGGGGGGSAFGGGGGGGSAFGGGGGSAFGGGSGGGSAFGSNATFGKGAGGGGGAFGSNATFGGGGGRGGGGGGGSSWGGGAAGGGGGGSGGGGGGGAAALQEKMLADAKRDAADAATDAKAVASEAAQRDAGAQLAGTPVSAAELESWGLSQVQYELFNAPSFEFERIPEVPPPPPVA